MHGGNRLTNGRIERAGRPITLKISKRSLHPDLLRLDIIKLSTSPQPP
jgi:hypothetical protein